MESTDDIWIGYLVGRGGLVGRGAGNKHRGCPNETKE